MPFKDHTVFNMDSTEKMIYKTGNKKKHLMKIRTDI